MKYIVQKLLALLLALAISFLFLWYGMLHLSWIDGIFLPVGTNPTSPGPKHEFLQVLRGSIFWESPFMAIVSAVVALQIILSKWRPVKVFFSYHLKDIAVVQELNDALRKHGIQAQLCYFELPDHDDVITAVLAGIKACDALLVLPGTEPSFIDAEILAATVAQKAVVLIERESETLPNTAYEGYPVFLLAKLQEEDFKPLVSFLNFVHGRLASIKELIAERLLVICLFLLIPLLFLSVVEFVSDTTALYFGTRTTVRISMYVSIVWAALLACVVLVGIAWANFNRLRAARVVRQSIITRTSTYEILEGCLPITEDIQSYLKVSPLMKRHI